MSPVQDDVAVKLDQCQGNKEVKAQKTAAAAAAAPIFLQQNESGYQRKQKLFKSMAGQYRKDARPKIGWPCIENYKNIGTELDPFMSASTMKSI